MQFVHPSDFQSAPLVQAPAHLHCLAVLKSVHLLRMWRDFVCADRHRTPGAPSGSVCSLVSLGLVNGRGGNWWVSMVRWSAVNPVAHIGDVCIEVLPRYVVVAPTGFEPVLLA